MYQKIFSAEPMKEQTKKDYSDFLITKATKIMVLKIACRPTF